MLNLLESTPDGGWVQANTNRFSDAWVAGPDALPSGSYSNPAGIVHAWSSFAWDPNRGNLLLWGGGHANYMGNEMYIWQGTSGQWTRGSVSSRLVQYNGGSTYFTVDNAAPQSAHTYDNNAFLPLSDLFITFGGASFNSGGVFVNKGPTGAPVRSGPWIWDPRRADPAKVGGTTGSGYNPTTLGGQMWFNQQGKWVGAEAPSYVEGTTAYRQENGRDVIYVTGDSNASGWPSLYRYEPGDARSGAIGTFAKVATAWNAPSYQGVGSIDSINQLYVRTSNVNGFPSGFGVWDLTRQNPANPQSLQDVLVRLALPNGSFFVGSVDFGADFDDARGKFVLWDGHQGGTVYETAAVVDSARNIASVWPITPIASTTTARPAGNFQTGVLGKWRYVAQLAAFVALDEYSNTSADAGVWLYRPMGWKRPGSTGGNTPPTVALTSPTDGASAAAPGSFAFTATANDADGSVARVDYYASTTLLGSSNVAPYAFTWSNVSPGSYSVRAVATDNAGAAGSSSSVQVTVNSIAISTSANPATVGASITLTATVTGTAPMGTVTFTDGGSPVPGCSAVSLVGANNTRTAACVTSNLPIGAHSIVATYNGDLANHFVATTPLSQVITGSAGAGDTVWVDDAVPVGGIPTNDAGNPWNTAWTWVSTNPAPNTGARAHRSAGNVGIRQHYFYGASATLPVGSGDTLFAYVYLDPANLPKQLLLQWNDGTWEHRAYWGTNLIGWGTEGTASLRYMGSLPAAGQWVRLQIPAAQVGLEGRTLNGVAFAHFDGVATWDSAGKAGASSGGNVPPTVTLTSPADGAGATAPAAFVLAANATDSDGSIARVDFYAGSTLVGSSTAAPYTFTWSGVSAGTYVLKAVGVDHGNASTTSALVTVSVTAANVPPTVALTSPPNGTSATAPATVLLSANAADSDGTIARVDFYAGSTLIGTDTTPPYSVTWSNVAPGSYTLKAVAVDNQNAATTSILSTLTVTAVVANVPPTVALTAPSGGTSATAPATIVLSANAADSDGTVARVDFYAGPTLIGTDTSAPYSVTWSNVQAGAYALTAVAVDNQNATTTSSAVTVTVVPANAPPTVAITAPTNGTTLPAPATLQVTANATDGDGTVSRVDFYAGTTLIGSDTTAPFSVPWSNVSAGAYTITAIAVDNLGASTTSTPISVTVTATGNTVTVTLQDGTGGYTGTRDTFLSSYYPTTNYGLLNTLRANAQYTDLVRFAIFQAEGGPVPNGATILSATLSLYKSTYYDFTYKVSRMLRDWNETQATWSQRASRQTWTVPGALGAGTDYVATADATVTVGWEPQWLTATVTTGVQAMAAGQMNFGWRLLEVSGNGNDKEFYSRDYTNATLRPKLVIQYAN